MFDRKCSGCGKKIERKFNYCPYCGESFKDRKMKDDFGMLGKDDFVDNNLMTQGKLPFGLDKLMGSLMKQIEKDMGKMMSENGEMPKGFKVQIRTGMPGQFVNPQMKQVRNEKKGVREIKVSEEEIDRRKKLKKEDAVSKVKRLGDRIVYEIETPGLDSKNDVVITKLESGIEIKAFGKRKCYVKVIPFAVEIIGYSVKADKLYVELKG